MQQRDEQAQGTSPGMLRRAYAAAGLTEHDYTWILLATVLVTLCAMVGGDVTEDVAGRDGITHGDPGRLQWFVAHRTPFSISVARQVTTLGGAPLLLGVAVVAAVLLWRRGLGLIVALAPAAALAATAIVTTVAKPGFDRARPPLGLRLVVENEPSFPSGHSGDSAALYLTLAFVVAAFVMRRRAGRCLVIGGAAALVGAIGTSRLVLGVHWPTDVVGGWALGTVVATAVTAATIVAGRHTRSARSTDTVEARHTSSRLRPIGP